jgi:protein trunk
MSIDEPKIEDFENDEETPSLKRDAQNFKPFYVDDTYVMELSDKPAWEVTHLTETERNNKREIEERSKNSTERTKRQSNNRRRNEDSATQPQQQKRPWECEAKIKWIDLGYDYYPRYLRTVECTRHACFYGHFTCKPRSFTVKLLRRRRGECVPTRYNIGIENLHEDLRELWVWEERAVNFCCDCAAR